MPSKQCWSPVPHRFIELCLLLQIETNDAVVVIDPVTVEVIHLSCNQTQETNYLTEAFIIRSSFTQFKLVTLQQAQCPALPAQLLFSCFHNLFCLQHSGYNGTVCQIGRVSITHQSGHFLDKARFLYDNTQVHKDSIKNASKIFFYWGNCSFLKSFQQNFG